MDFLYFPDDKTEYIGSFIVLVIFMIGAVVAMYFIYKKSKKDEKYFDENFEDFNEPKEHDIADKEVLEHNKQKEKESANSKEKEQNDL